MERKLNVWRSPLLKQLLIGVSTNRLDQAKQALRDGADYCGVGPMFPTTTKHKDVIAGPAYLREYLLRYWPAIFAGAFLVNLTTAGTVLTSLGIAAGNCLEAVTACYLINRFANGKDVFDRTWDILRFALYAGILSGGIAATFGVTSLALGGFAPWHQYGIIWRTWWLGDAAGALVFAPFLLLWSANPIPRWSQRQVAEAGALLASTLQCQESFSVHCCIRKSEMIPGRFFARRF